MPRRPCLPLRVPGQYPPLWVGVGPPPGLLGLVGDEYPPQATTLSAMTMTSSNCTHRRHTGNQRRLMADSFRCVFSMDLAVQPDTLIRTTRRGYVAPSTRREASWHDTSARPQGIKQAPQATGMVDANHVGSVYVSSGKGGRGGVSY